MRRQRFSFDSGRVSMTRTRSPTLASVLLVVDVETLGALHGLAVARVAHPLDDGDDDGGLHLVGDHEALAHLAPPAALARCLLGHQRRPPRHRPARRSRRRRLFRRR